MSNIRDGLSLIAWNGSPDTLGALLDVPGVVIDRCHALYPADDGGSHFLKFASMEPLIHHSLFLGDIVAAMTDWIVQRKMDPTVIVAPDQLCTREIARALALALDVSWALREYLPSGRFGDRCVVGSIGKGDRALVFNGVSLQGRCVGRRLPEFAERFGAGIVGAAVFVKSRADAFEGVRKRFGGNFYAAVEIDAVPYTAQTCPACRANGSSEPLRPWYEIVAEAAGGRSVRQ